MRLEKTWPARLGAVMLALVAIGFVGTLRPAPAHATTFQLIANVERAQAQSTCPGSSGATGAAFVTYDDVSNLLTWNITFSGLSGAPNAAHFHGPAAKGVDAGIQVTIGDLTSPSEGSATITETQEGQLLAGLWYVNYHTAMCPGGETRGQVRQAKIGGLAGAPELDGAPLTTDEGSGANTGLMIAIAAGAAAVVLGGGATLAWRRRVR